jgi:hypothetical protein
MDSKLTEVLNKVKNIDVSADLLDRVETMKMVGDSLKDKGLEAFNYESAGFNLIWNYSTGWTLHDPRNGNRIKMNIVEPERNNPHFVYMCWSRLPKFLGHLEDQMYQGQVTFVSLEKESH